MYRFWKTLTGIALVVGVGGMALAPARPAQAQEAAKPAQKKVKDQAEWELFDAVTKATDPNQKIKLLTTWKEKYPESDFKDDRLVYFIQTYAQAGKFPEAINAGKELLAIDARNITAMFFINNLSPLAYPANPPADALDTAEKAANGLLAAEMPAGTKPEEWTKAKKDLDTAAHKTLGWVAVQRKDFAGAEQHLTKSLELNPNQGEVSYWLGSALLQTRQPEKQAPALYHIARAVSLEPASGGLPDPATRKQIDDYLTKSYTTLHGSGEGLAQLKATARANALPPPDFTIKTAAQIAAEKEEEFRQSNPALALWMGLKKELTGPNGSQFFASTMKDAQVPGGAAGINQLKGHLIAAKPAVRSKELVIGVADANTPEVTLRLETALTGRPVVGSELSFEGVPVEFSQDPFMITFEQGKVSGLQMEAPAPARKAPARKKK